MTRHFVTDVPTSATTDPNDKRHLGVEEHEASARALAEANQTPAAIQAWHRAAIGHARAGNAAGVIAAITHAEHLANNRDFSPDLERKSTAADAALERAKANIAPFRSTGADAIAAATGAGPVETVETLDGIPERLGCGDDPTTRPTERDRDWKRPKNSTAAADSTKTNSTPAERL